MHIRKKGYKAYLRFSPENKMTPEKAFMGASITASTIPVSLIGIVAGHPELGVIPLGAGVIVGQTKPTLVYHRSKKVKK